MEVTIFLIILLSANILALPEEISNKIEDGINIKKTSGYTLESLLKTIDTIKERQGPLLDEMVCATCKKVISTIIGHRKSGSSKEAMTSFLKMLCYTFTDWGKVACDGYSDIETDTILYIIDNNQNLTSDRVCAIALQVYNCTDPAAKNWAIDLPDDPIGRLKIKPNIPYGDGPLRILHLTDIHYDPSYKAGSNAKCDVPLCCEESNGPPADPQDAAGYWGDYNVCDMPWYSVVDLMTHINQSQDKFDLIYFTGDIISHKSWATSKDHNTQAIKDVFKLLQDTFKNITIFPILGNHEPHPTDFYSPGEVVDDKISTQWVFDLMANEWSRWLPTETQNSIKQGGFYTVLVKKGFRIIGLNSNLCYTSNLWLINEDEDPYDQLKWLVQVLTQAEIDHELVHILSHIPPGDTNCLKQWGSQFRRIVNRFSNTISAQFNGHTHYDEFRVFYDLNDTKKVVNVAFNGGSFTTFVGFNPNYRIYEIDSNNFMVSNYDHFTYNLTQANLAPNVAPNWYKIYSFREAYTMQDLSYNSFGDLLDRMEKNDSIVQEYYRFLVRDSDPEMSKGCNATCLENLLCIIVSVEPEEGLRCRNRY